MPAAPFLNNIGAYLDPEAACAKHLIEAGTGTDNSKKTGATIDRQGYYSLTLAIIWIANLAASKTISFAIEYQESADGSDWETAVAIQASTVAGTGVSGGSTGLTGLVETDINLNARMRYIKFNITCDLSNTGTDTAAFTSAAILGGAIDKPA